MTEHQQKVHDAFLHAINTEIREHMVGRKFALSVDGQYYTLTLDDWDEQVTTLTLSTPIPRHARKWWHQDD